MPISRVHRRRLLLEHLYRLLSSGGARNSRVACRKCSLDLLLGSSHRARLLQRCGRRGLLCLLRPGLGRLRRSDRRGGGSLGLRGPVLVLHLLQPRADRRLHLGLCSVGLCLSPRPCLRGLARQRHRLIVLLQGRCHLLIGRAHRRLPLYSRRREDSRLLRVARRPCSVDLIRDSLHRFHVLTIRDSLHVLCHITLLPRRPQLGDRLFLGSLGGLCPCRGELMVCGCCRLGRHSGGGLCLRLQQFGLRLHLGLLLQPKTLDRRACLCTGSRECTLRFHPGCCRSLLCRELLLRYRRFHPSPRPLSPLLLSFGSRWAAWGCVSNVQHQRIGNLGELGEHFNGAHRLAI